MHKFFALIEFAKQCEKDPSFFNLPQDIQNALVNLLEVTERNMYPVEELRRLAIGGSKTLTKSALGCLIEDGYVTMPAPDVYAITPDGKEKLKEHE